ncbi:uncharacterized protein L3040_009583 [Drepanopeziza brunnea f. sp. 'multigermtubi']|uniref:Extracellular serine-rich protein n=1 Tax=Marssonina brunnea f. sp. multigermtubi (strain MB_m1) TaxID=1072389 RepID=K1WUU5_MARBU|nr:extracellular serine-rich protein [Drepanopeziza brunnea f. sp. 'multigermtubi' MB_m1]EKD16182.1 extracellular serine-rich protein [Drepanopeziza brunnea f. sp. 'multigermtubi' MB_m1]KAJ5032998.1 hypothetical protein L3040_009583 [Drepanopeziza brunnea f. sp. 'multigermtubi']
MQYSTLAVVLSTALVAFAYDYGNSAATPTVAAVAAAAAATSSASPVHSVTVGKSGLVFDPSTITAQVGDKIEFHFFPSRHSVAQSSFAKPCEPLNATSFFSGGVTTAAGENANTFTITVNDTKPIWFYCAAPGHCARGMAGVINAPTDSSKTLEMYIAAAADVSAAVAPTRIQGGIISPAQAVLSSGTPSSSSSSSSSAPSTSMGEAREEIRWSLFALMWLGAVGFGCLIG